MVKAGLSGGDFLLPPAVRREYPERGPPICNQDRRPSSTCRRGGGLCHDLMRETSMGLPPV